MPPHNVSLGVERLHQSLAAMPVTPVAQQTDDFGDWYRSLDQAAQALDLETQFDENRGYTDGEDDVVAVLIGRPDPQLSHEDDPDHHGGHWVRVRLPSHDTDSGQVYLVPDPAACVNYAARSLSVHIDPPDLAADAGIEL